MKTIALFVHQPYCSVQSDNGIIEALSPYYRFKIFTRHELEDDFFNDVDCLCVPGGIGDADKFDMCFENNKSAVKRFFNGVSLVFDLSLRGSLKLLQSRLLSPHTHR